MSVALIGLLCWIVALPLVVLAVTEVGWRIGEWRRSRRRPVGVVLPLTGWFSDAAPRSSAGRAAQ